MPLCDVVSMSRSALDTGANATRVALIARTVSFRTAVDASRLSLQGVASGLRGGHFGGEHVWWRGEDADCIDVDGSGSTEGWGGAGLGGGKGGIEKGVSAELGAKGWAAWTSFEAWTGAGAGGGAEGKVASKRVCGERHLGVVGTLDAATSAMLGVAATLRSHLTLPDNVLARERTAMQATLKDARLKLTDVTASLARSGSAALHGLEDAAADAARDATSLLEHHVHALLAQLESTPEAGTQCTSARHVIGTELNKRGL